MMFYPPPPIPDLPDLPPDDEPRPNALERALAAGFIGALFMFMLVAVMGFVVLYAKC